MEWLLEPFAYSFQQRALIGGLLAAVMTSFVGTWLVLRGMSFFGDAFVHGVVPGIAAATVVGFSPVLGAALAALVMVLLIETTLRSSRVKEDTAIGLMFVGMLALGVVIISSIDSYSGSLTAILFGDVLGVTAGVLWQQAVLTVIIIIGVMVLYRPLLVMSLSETKAHLLGLRPRLTHLLLLMLIAAAVVGSYQAVGTLLVFGLLIGPPATAALFARSVPIMIVISLAVGAVGVVAGLVISYHIGTAASATMALIPVVFFFVALAGKRVFSRDAAPIPTTEAAHG